MDVKYHCLACGSEFYVPHWRKNVKYCSVKCAHEGLKGKANAICPQCGAGFHCKPSHLKRFKNICCSRECFIKLKRNLMSGESNHQYGLKGEKNASFKSTILIRQNNKLAERMVYVGDWYVKPNECGRITEHRYMVEKNWELYDPNMFELINGWHYLKDNIVVHHIDFNHDNNDISNLQPLSKGEHSSLHNKKRNIRRDGKGRFIASGLSEADRGSGGYGSTGR